MSFHRRCALHALRRRTGDRQGSHHGGQPLVTPLLDFRRRLRRVRRAVAAQGLATDARRMNPIHPALAALARSARSQDFEETENALVVALRRREWLRPEHRVGDPTGYM